MIGELRTALDYIHRIRVKVEMHPPKRIKEEYVTGMKLRLLEIEESLEAVLRVLTNPMYRKGE